VNGTDYIRIDERTYLHFYNDSAVDDVVVYRSFDPYDVGLYWCQSVSLPAGTELVVGPFDTSKYFPILVVYHRCHGSILSGGVTMAALTTPCHEAAGVYINGVDFSTKLVPNTVNVIDQLDGRNTLSFTTRHLTDPDAGEVGQPVELWDSDTTQLFAGIITDRQRNQIGDVDGYEYAYKCADYSTLATRHLIGWNYEDMSADDIVLHINQYFLTGEGVVAVKIASGGHVEPGITLDKAVFNYCTVAEAFNQLAEQCGFSWYIDCDKELHFFERTRNIAPFELTDTDCHYITLDASESTAEYRNRQWIQGGNQLSEPRTETFLGDGKLTSFKLQYQVAKVPTITVDGVAQTTGIQSVDEDKDWYWSDNSDTITQSQKVEAYKKFSSIEYDFSDNADATLKNRSEAGVGMDATAYENSYRPLSTGAGSWRFTNAADYIKIPHDIPIDNLQQMTMEWIFWWGLTSTDPRLFDKGDFIVYINNTTNSVSIWRYGIGGGYIVYSTPANTITVGHYYHVQIVWDSTTIGNLPTVYINGAKQTVTATTTGTVTAFMSDSSYDAYIGNRAAFNRPFYGSFLLFRLFRSSIIPPMSYPDPDTLTTGLLTEEQLRQNYLAERWRYSHTSQGDILEQDQKLSVTYQYSFPLLDVVDDATAQATQAALEGSGTGIYETIENDGTLDDTSWALEKAARLLAKYGTIPEVVKFTTHTPGLKAGQLLTVDLPDLDLDDAYLITEVSTADESFVQYTYDVTAASGEALGGWTKFFTDEAASGRTFKINEGQTLVLLTRSPESLTVTDSFSQTNGAPAHTATTDAKVGFSECVN
jgi:hypothetical protein